MRTIFEDDDYYTSPPLDERDVERAQSIVGYGLPASYLELLNERNGGRLRARCFPTTFPTSWADDHIGVLAIRGIGGEWGIDSSSGLGSEDMIREWQYPEIGIVICETPSGGHDTVMLDYSECGPAGEPSVAYIDEDRIPRRLASSFSEFLDGLYVCDE